MKRSVAPWETVHLITLFTICTLHAQAAYAAFDEIPPPSDDYTPRSRPDFTLADIPCDLRDNHVCTRAGKAYPWYGMANFIADNRAMIKRLYGSENRRGPSANRPQGPIIQTRDPRGVATNACPSEQFVVTPFWANNSDGNTLALVNFHPFEQAIQQEICKTGVQGRCRDGCQCEQKHAWYRLLAFDPRNECKGIFMDWFQFPSCCACNCYDNGSHDSQQTPSTTIATAPPTAPSIPAVESGKSDSDLMTAKILSITPSLAFQSDLTSANGADGLNQSTAAPAMPLATTTPPTTTASPSTSLRMPAASAATAATKVSTGTSSSPSSTPTTTITQSSSSAPSTATPNVIGPLGRASLLLPNQENFVGDVTNSPISGSRARLTTSTPSGGSGSRARGHVSLSPIKTNPAVPSLGSPATAAFNLVTDTDASGSGISSTTTAAGTTTTDADVEDPSSSSSSTIVPWYFNVLPAVNQDQADNFMKVIDVAIRRNRIPRI